MPQSDYEAKREKRKKGKGRMEALLLARRVLKFAFAARTINFPNFRQTNPTSLVPAIRVAVKSRLPWKVRFPESRTVFSSNPGSQKYPSRYSLKVNPWQYEVFRWV